MSFPFADGTAALAHVFRASQLSTPLTAAITVDLREPTGPAVARLRAERFEQAPVTVGRGKYAGWVLTDELERAGSVKQVLRQLALSTIVSVDAPVRDLLGVLAREQLVFLAGHRGLEAFVTTTDLDRHAARGHFYLLLSGIEMALADLVAAAVPAAQVEAAIRDESRQRWDAARAENAETRPVEYLNLQALAELFEAAAAGDSRWDRQMAARLTELCKLRSPVMHPVRPLLAERQPAQLAQLAASADVVTARLEEFRTAWRARAAEGDG